MATSIKILLWNCEDILSSSIEFFLTSHEDWKVVSISKKEGLYVLNRAVETSHPDFVIIQQGTQIGSTNLALQLLQDHPAIKVIVLSLENNMLDIYSKQKIFMQKATDLIGVIENES